MNEALSLINGASMEIREKITPIPPFTSSFLALPSFIFTSKMDETRPPYCDGIPPLNNFTSLTASGLNTEKKPNK